MKDLFNHLVRFKQRHGKYEAELLKMPDGTWMARFNFTPGLLPLDLTACLTLDAYLEGHEPLPPEYRRVNQ